MIDMHGCHEHIHHVGRASKDRQCTSVTAIRHMPCLGM